MFLGILIFVFGLMLLIETIIPAINFNIFIYISMAIFLSGLYNINAKNKLSFANIFVTVMGLILVLINLNVIPLFLIKTIVPLLIIALGIVIIYNTSLIKKPYNYNYDKMKKYNAFLADNKEKIDELESNGIQTYAIFGNMNLDLSDLKINEDKTLLIYTIFGQSIVKLSDNYNININSTSVLGENVKEVNIKDRKSKKTININIITILGRAKVIENEEDNSKE